MRKMIVNGYVYPLVEPWILNQAAPNLTFLSLFTYGMTAEGNLVSLKNTAPADLVRPYGVESLMVLSALSDNGEAGREAAVAVFRNEEAQNRVIDQILKTLQEENLFGVDFDFEFVPAQDRDNYTTFVKRTRERLNPLGYVVTVALAPKISSDQKGLLYQGHDYGGMGAAANLVLLMTYEWGYTYGPPMAVAPLNRVRQVLDYGVTQIPSEKILMGIPNYGYDWTLPFVQGESRARSISNVEAQALAVEYGAQIQWDPVAYSPFFFYTDEQGRQHEVWFEDASSIRGKLELVEEYGLAGVSYWNLMRPFPANWQVLREMYEVVKL